MCSNVPVIERGNYSALQPLAEQWRAPPAERAHACHIGGNRHSELARGQWQVGRQYETKELWRQEHCDKACEMGSMEGRLDGSSKQNDKGEGRGGTCGRQQRSGICRHIRYTCTACP